MAYALGLPDALRRRGLTVEVVPGWETRSAGSFNPKGAVAHWTAGPRGSKTRPSLNVVVNGRPDLPGPLCNVYGARDGVAVVVAAGRANHAGAGGWRGLVGNSAVFGTEMEGADAADFTDAQRWSYPRIHAAYCDLGGFGPEMNCGHSEWAGPRKADINGYTPDILRRDIAAVLAGDDDMQAGEFYGLKGSDGRNLFDGIIQTRAELKDRAADALTDRLFNTRVDGRNLFDWMIQLRADEAANAARDAARDEALLAVVRHLPLGGIDPQAIVDAAAAGATKALDRADFPSAEKIAEMVMDAQERAELEGLRARVAELEQATTSDSAA